MEVYSLTLLNFITYEKIKFFLFTSFFLLTACSKEETAAPENMSSDKLQKTVSETYVYENKEYTLYFDPTNEDGEPINNDVAEELLKQIGEQEIWLVGKASELNKRHIYTNADDAENFLNLGREFEHMPIPKAVDKPSNSSLRSTPPPCWWFHEDCGFDGEGLELQSTANYYVSGGLNDCTHYWSHNNLQYVNRQGANGNWNDLASSWTLTRPICMGHSMPDVGLMKIKVYRHADFPGWACGQEGWVVDVNNLNISCLTNEHWCVFGSDLNDEISSWRMVVCKLECNECFSISHGER